MHGRELRSSILEVALLEVRQRQVHSDTNLVWRGAQHALVFQYGCIELPCGGEGRTKITASLHHFRPDGESITIVVNRAAHIAMPLRLNTLFQKLIGIRR